MKRCTMTQENHRQRHHFFRFANFGHRVSNQQSRFKQKFIFFANLLRCTLYSFVPAPAS